MLKKIFHKLVHATRGQKGAHAAPPLATKAQRHDYPGPAHGISPEHIPRAALDVVRTLQGAGFEAMVVGGAVRDLLLGLKPKDFDVATNATPEQVKRSFRRAYFVGRRFRIVHVQIGRETIEVTTFRGPVTGSFEPSSALPDEDVDAGIPVVAEREQPDHVVDSSGRILRDNVWGTLEEDATRRDFTINAMYYDPVRNVVVDFHDGMRDLRARQLRLIGEPEARYREDPVRILRALRFQAKLEFGLESRTQAPIPSLWPLLKEVPSARLTDETLKLLQGGYAVRCVALLRKAGLPQGLSPFMDLALTANHPLAHHALVNTDARVAQGKRLSASFMVACMIWPHVRDGWQRRLDEGERDPEAMLEAFGDTQEALQAWQSRRVSGDVAEILLVQTRVMRRTPRVAEGLVSRPRFRAGLDLLKLRAEVGEVDATLPQWWEDYYAADPATRQHMLASLGPQGRSGTAPRRRRRRGAGKTNNGSTHGLGQPAATLAEPPNV